MSYENIVVYCGSHFGNDPAYAAFAGELERVIST
jgi:predicted Rossmann-fold nucleotide-binding protein